MMNSSHRPGLCKNLDCPCVYTEYVTLRVSTHVHAHSPDAPKVPWADGLPRQTRLHTLEYAQDICYTTILDTLQSHTYTHTHTYTQKCVWLCSENHKSMMTGDRDLSRADIVVIAVMLWRGCYVLQLWFLHSDRAQNRMSLLLTVIRGCAAIGQDDRERLLLWTFSTGYWTIHTEVGVEHKCVFLTLSICLQTPNHEQTIKRHLSVCLLRSCKQINLCPLCSCAQPWWPGLSICVSLDALPAGMVLSTKSPSGQLCSMRTTILALPPLMTATSTAIH